MGSQDATSFIKRYNFIAIGLLLLILFAVSYTLFIINQIDYLDSKVVGVYNGLSVKQGLSSEQQKQLVQLSDVVGAFPSDIKSASCSKGQLLTFSNGQLICASIQTDANGIVGVNFLGIPSKDGTSSTLLNTENQKLLNAQPAPNTNVSATSDLTTTSSNGLNASISGHVLSLGIVTNAASGLTKNSNGLSLLMNCSMGQILKYNGTAWVCANDSVASNSAAPMSNLISNTPGITITNGNGAVLGSNPVNISLATAGSTDTGLLTSADWTTFTNKENALTFNGNGLFSRSGNEINSSSCASGQVLVYSGSHWVCSTSGGSGTIYTADGTLVLSAGNVFGMPSVGTAGTYGNAISIPVITTDAQGRVTGITNTAIAGLTTDNLAAAANIKNSQLTNSSITITPSTGVSGGGTVALGGTVTITNTGLLSLSGSGPISVGSGQDPAVSIAKASGTTDGYLSALDYATFAAKQAALTPGNLTADSGLTGIVTITGGTGATANSAGASISIATATGTQTGLLNTVDWNTFNNKENVLTFSGGIMSKSGNTISATTCAVNQVLVYDGTTWNCSARISLSGGAAIDVSTGNIISVDMSALTPTSVIAGTDTLMVQSGSTVKKITYDNLVSGINSGSLNYQGTWDASANTPNLTSVCTTSTKGYYYGVTVAGSTVLNSGADAIGTWNVSDWAVCNGSIWQRVQATNAVNSIFGRTGIVTAQNGDYNASQITNTPAGSITDTTVQSALNQLDTTKLSTSLASGLIFAGNASNVAEGVAISGDATLASNGTLTIANNAVTSAKIADGTIQFADFASNSCSSGQSIVFNGTSWICGTNSITYTAANTGSNANSPISVSGTSIGFSDATTTGSYWAWDGSKWALVAPSTICDPTKQTICNGGNTLGTTVSIGTTDGNVLALRTSGTDRFQVATDGATLTGQGNTILTALSGSSITLDSTGIGAVNVGTGAASKAITFGNTTGTTGITGYVGTGGLTMDGVGSSNYKIGQSTTTGAFTVGGDHQTGTANLFAGDGGLTVNFGTSGNNAMNMGSSGTALVFDSNSSINNSAATATNAYTFNGNTITTADVVKIVANALTSGNAFEVGSSSAAFSGNLAKFGLSGSSASNTGTIVNISSGANTNVLPLSITSGNSQLASYTNGSGATTGSYTGTGSPEGVVTANIGSIYTSTDTGNFYIKKSGTSNTGWLLLAPNSMVDYINTSRITANQTMTSGNDMIFNKIVSGNIPYDTSTGIYTLTAGKTYQLTVTPYFSDFTDTTNGYIQYSWVDATTSNRLDASVNGVVVPAVSAINEHDPGTSSVIYTPSSNQTVKIRSMAALGSADLRFGYSTASIVQIGSNATSGIPMNYLTNAIASGSLDNAGYTQTWNWNSLGSNNGLVLNSSDTTTTGNLFSITNASTGAVANGLARFNFSGAHTGSGFQVDDATATGTAMALNANSLTSGTGLSINSAATGFIGTLVNVYLGSNSVTNTGTLMSLSTAGTSNAVTGLKINVIGSGLALDVSGSVAYRSGTDYTGVGTQNDVSLLGSSSNYRLDPASALTLNGIAGGTGGKMLILNNVSTTTVTIENQAAASAAANRIITGSGSNIILASDQSATLLYDATTARWRVISVTAPNPTYGDTAATAAFTTSSTTFTSTGLSVAIPSAGTWAVTYTGSLFSTVAETVTMGLRLVDGSDTQVANSLTTSTSTAANVSQTVSQSVNVVTTGGATYTLQMKTSGQSGTLQYDTNWSVPHITYRQIK